jgi:hypothetical protein
MVVSFLLVAQLYQPAFVRDCDARHGGPELGIVEPVEKMDAAGAGCRDANTEPAGPLGVATSHEGGRLLVPDLNEADAILLLAQGLDDPVDPVTGDAEDHFDAPVEQGFDENVGGCGGHRSSPEKTRVGVPAVPSYWSRMSRRRRSRPQRFRRNAAASFRIADTGRLPAHRRTRIVLLARLAKQSRRAKPARGAGRSGLVARDRCFQGAAGCPVGSPSP